MYEMKRYGVTYCISSLPKCGYSEKIFRDMLSAGFEYFIDGKLHRKAGA